MSSYGSGSPAAAARAAAALDIPAPRGRPPAAAAYSVATAGGDGSDDSPPAGESVAEGLFRFGSSCGAGGAASPAAAAASYGASPGHGLGHLMRAQRWPAPRREPAAALRSGSGGVLETHAEGEAERRDEEAAGSPAPLPPSPARAAAAAAAADSLDEPLLPGAPAAPKRRGEHHHHRHRRAPTPVAKAVVFGLINSVAGIPALVAFCNIVFRDEVYAPRRDGLARLFFFASATHQAVFNLLSALPFAMGQVQDVGIIFLSAIASSVAAICADAGESPAVALATALVAMSASTLLVGAVTWVIAKRRLADLVKHIPLPVMGGYLAFVGYFCLASGMGLGAGVELAGFASWGGLFAAGPLLRLLPTLAAAAAMVATLERFEHPLALPSVLVALVAAFHLALAAAGVPLADAAAAGWVAPGGAANVRFWTLWYDLYGSAEGGWLLARVNLGAVARQAGKAAGLALVVAFGSCMDILAVAQDVEGGVDFDAELATVAAANAAAGLAGVGFTGSYIFSQTVWTLRQGVLSRVNGWVIVAAELAAFAAPFSVTQFLPNFFLGALLCWFGFEIARDWLVLSHRKLSGVEYGLLWGTFLAIVQLGLERGIAAGVAGACVYFCWAYARSQLRSLELAGPARRSGVVRTVEQRAALDLLFPRCARAARLRGFCFFASAPNIARRLEEASAALAAPGGGAALGDGYTRGAPRAAALAALEAAPRFLLLDLSRVTGMDASGARAVAGAVLAARAATGVEPVLAAADRHGALELLAAHGLAARRMRWPPALQPADGGGGAAAPPTAPDDAGAEVPLFPTAEEALRYCEDALLAAATRSGLIPPPSAALPLEALLRSHLDGGAPEVAAPESAAAAARALRRFGAARRLRRGERLWALGDPAAAMFLVEAGELRVDELRRAPPPPPGAEAAPSGRVVLWADPPAGARLELVRSFELGPGCVLGATDFYLGRAHRTIAACASPEARVLELSREALRRMAAEAPEALNLLQAVVMRLNASDLAAAAEMVAGAEP